MNRLFQLLVVIIAFNAPVLAQDALILGSFEKFISLWGD